MKKIIPFKKDIIFKTHVSEVTSISLEHSLHMESDNLITGEFLISGEYKISDTSTNTEIFNFNLPFDIHMDEHYDLEDCTVDIYDFYYEIINNNILSVNIEVSVNNFKEKPLIEEKKRDVTDILQEAMEDNTLEAEAVRRDVDAIMDAIDEVKMESAQEEAVQEIERNDIVEEKETVQKEEIEAVAAIPENSVVQEASAIRQEEIPVSKSQETVEVAEKMSSIFPEAIANSETFLTYRVYIVRENDSLEMILEKYQVTKEQVEAYNDLKELKIGDKLIIPSSQYAKN